MARRGSRFSGRRGNRFAQVRQYDYGPSGAITTDFGAIADEVYEKSQKTREIEQERKKQMEAAEEAAREATDFPFTGNADIDSASMSLAQQSRDTLFEAKKQIGTMVDGKPYTVDDFMKYKNNLINNAKIYKGNPELVKKTMEGYESNDKLSDITKDAYANSVGSMYGKDSAYNLEVDKDGNFMVKNSEGINVNLKSLALNGVQEVDRFDSTSDIKTLQDVYAKTQTTFEIDGQTYKAEEVMGNPVLFTKHISSEPPEFMAAKKQYIENFSNDDQKVVSYLYDKLGVKLGQDGDESIGLDEQGRFVISDKLREKARVAFSKEVDGAFGIEEKGRAQVMARARAGTGKPEKRATIASGLKQTFSSETYPNVDDKGQQVSHGAQDIINKMRAVSAARMAADPQAAMNDFLKKDHTFADPASKEATEYNAFDTQFRNENTDLYIDGRQRDLGPITTKADIDKGKTDFEGVSIGLDLTEADLKEFGLVSSAKTAMTGISGISFSYRRQMKPGAAYDPNVEGDFDINKHTDKVPTGIRLAGNSVIQSQSVGQNVQIPEGELTGKTASEQRKQQFSTTVFSNNITDDKIPQLVKMMSKSSPNIQRAFEQALRGGAQNNTVAFYNAINALKVN